jgi:hypothetical protein
MIAFAGTVPDFRAIEASLEYFRRYPAKLELELGLFYIVFLVFKKCFLTARSRHVRMAVMFAAHPLLVLRALGIMFAGPIDRKRPLVSQH